MKQLLTILAIGTAMALSACADTNGSADYSYESSAPYASERTVGTRGATPTRAETVFQAQQLK